MATRGAPYHTSFTSTPSLLSPTSTLMHRQINARNEAYLSKKPIYSERLIGTTVSTEWTKSTKSTESTESTTSDDQPHSDEAGDSFPQHTTPIAPAA